MSPAGMCMLRSSMVRGTSMHFLECWRNAKRAASGEAAESATVAVSKNGAQP